MDFTGSISIGREVKGYMQIQMVNSNQQSDWAQNNGETLIFAVWSEAPFELRQGFAIYNP